MFCTMFKDRAVVSCVFAPGCTLKTSYRVIEVDIDRVVEQFAQKECFCKILQYPLTVS